MALGEISVENCALTIFKEDVGRSYLRISPVEWVSNHQWMEHILFDKHNDWMQVSDLLNTPFVCVN